MLSAVGGLEHTALFVRPPFAADATGPDQVGVLRVDDEPRDLVGFVEADLCPVIAPVHRLVHAVAHRRAVARISLAGADIYDVRITRRHGNRADGRYVLLVKDVTERHSTIRRLDDSACRAGHVVRTRVTRNAGHH